MSKKFAYKKIYQKPTAFQLKPVCAALLIAFGSPQAIANPMGGVVVNGQANMATVGNTLTVTNTPGTIINWQGFSIGANEVTRFIQQSASSAVLNRVIGNNPSNILGTLQSNGRVFLINPNGIVFGAGSVVDVAGLVASTLNMSNADFLAGRYNFTKVPGAQNISNAGNLNAQQGGQIFLIAPNVDNSGVINAPGGEILLAAGNSVELVNSLDPNLRVNITSPAGNVTNLGQLVADAGNLGLFGAVVKNSGSVSADSASLRGGKIVLKASQRVDAGGTISAKGVGGGEINVLSDMQSGTVRVSGTLDASAPVSGNGGLIETSAAFVNIADTARVSTLAANGKNGTWLIDPFDFTIAAAGGNVTGATLSASLAAGNVIIQSTAGTTGVSGDVNVNDVVSWSVTQLTLNAQNNININANMNGSGTARLALEYGQQAVAAGNSSGYKLGSGVAVNLPAGNNFSTKLGSDGAVTTFTVITALGAAGSVTATDLQGINSNLAGNYVLGGNIDASATSTWNTGLGFDPLGNSTTRFTGKFDGLGHTVTGLNINRPAQVHVGLFGYVGVGGAVSNVGLLTPVITGSSTVGGLVGFNEGAVSNSYVSGGVVNAAWYTAGGLVGENTGTVSNSYVSGGSVHSNNWNAGGLVGRNTSGSISGSYVSGVDVSGSSSDVGGLAGLNAAGATITNSYVTGGSVHAAWSSAGGLVGDNQGAISNSYVSGGTVSSVKWNTGGLVGGNKATGTINTSFVLNTSVSNSTGTSNAGGLVGRNAGAISNSYVNGGTVSGGLTVGGLVGWNATGASITNSYANTGSVSGGEPRWRTGRRQCGHGDQ
ncbi:MAG: filamentous hemagglutinin N-terminal domain-containing protein [Gallionella sp.]|nr:filamentous hemagglutinin N-terminal domain-containing protein [Gallionella sp.]